MNSHQEQWKNLQSAFANHRISQAMLFVGPLHCALEDFAKRIIQLHHCDIDHGTPCLKCIDCQMVERMEHPDVEWIKPEKNGGAIKVDQIRELQNSVYLTPQRSNYRIIVIEAADRMNTAAANALLKILEEPAKHAIFVLIAQQLSTVLPTVLSRCQRLTFSSIEDSSTNNLLVIGEQYPQESDRAVVFCQAEVILEGLIALIEGKQHPCVLAAQWTQFELGSLLWFLYLVYSQLQKMHVLKMNVTGPVTIQLEKLLLLLNPILIFAQIDKINTLLRKLSHNINMNHTLILEDLLLSLHSGT